MLHASGTQLGSSVYLALTSWKTTSYSCVSNAAVLDFASDWRCRMAREGRLAFGTFELDTVAGELRKRGGKLKLQGKPLALLAMLLENAGSIVTREELRRHLWPDDTFVDFDHSLALYV